MLEVLCVGDTSALVIQGREIQHFSCHHSQTLGASNKLPFRYRIERVQIHPGDLLVIHTDGLDASVSEMLQSMELRRRPAVVIAQELMERCAAGNDDAPVFVLRFASKGAA
jgi:serine/threonine protein phosphatase PrpC